MFRFWSRMTRTRLLLLGGYLAVLLATEAFLPELRSNRPLAFLSVVVPMVVTIALWRRTCACAAQ